MLRVFDFVDRKYIYQVKNTTIDDLLKSASNTFSERELASALAATQKAIALAYEALEQARVSQSGEKNAALDLAYCLRKQASLVIKNSEDADRWQTAKTDLMKVLALHEKYHAQADYNPIDKIEKSRALNQLQKIAYELKDGEFLESISQELLESVQNEPYNSFTFKAIEGLFHVAFSKNDYTKALAHIDKGIALVSSWPQFNKIEHPTYLATLYLHQAKTHLAILESMESTENEKKDYMKVKVEGSFWAGYDKRKEALQEAKKHDRSKCKKINQRLVKDFSLLFTIRCKRYLLGIQAERHEMSPYAYVMNQAEKILRGASPGFISNLDELLHDRIIEINAHEKISLDYSYFPNEAPSVHISKDLVDEILKRDLKNPPGFR